MEVHLVKSQVSGVELIKRDNKKKFLFQMGPVTAWVALFVLTPLAIILFFSFMQSDDFGRIIYKFTLNNYRLLLNSGYWKTFGKSLLLSFFTLISCIIIGYPVAYFISQYGGKLKSFYLMLIVIPSWTAYLIRLYAFKSITSRTGLLNNFLLDMNIISEPLELLYTPFIVVVGLVYTWLPFMILPLFAALDGLSKSLLEAASDLGANPVTRFFKITFPLTRGGLIAGTILVFIPTLGDWLVPALLGGAKVQMVGNLIAHKFIQLGDIPGGSTLSIFLGAVVILFLYLFLKVGGEDALEKIV